MIMNEIIPFNEHRFDACMAYIATKHKEPLSQYQMVKLHVMTDFLHLLYHGRPVIGGALERWPHGPVVKRAYNRIVTWGRRYDEHRAQPEAFEIVAKDRNAWKFKPTVPVDPDEFSKTELHAMDEAWNEIGKLRWDDSQNFFHDPSNYVGRVWTNACKDGAPISWLDILKAFEEVHEDSDTSNVRAMLKISGGE